MNIYLLIYITLILQNLSCLLAVLATEYFHTGMRHSLKTKLTLLVVSLIPMSILFIVLRADIKGKGSK